MSALVEHDTIYFTKVYLLQRYGKLDEKCRLKGNVAIMMFSMVDNDTTWMATKALLWVGR